MSYEYTQFKYIYPPRPENAIDSAGVGFYEKMGWIGQFKKNGTSTIIAISPSKQYIAMTRHATNHKAWQITDHIKKELNRLFPENFWIVLIAEVMHSKTREIKNTIYIHDMTVWDDKFLINSKFIDRQKILDEHLMTQNETTTHYVCDNEGKIWYAKRYIKNFKMLFDSIEDTWVDEGLVLKDPNGKLRGCDTPTKNSSWQVKLRHSTKNYQF